MEIKRYFTSKEVISFTGVSYRRLDYWLSKGIVKCSGRSSCGRGSTRLYTFNNLIEVRAVKELVEQGMRLNSLKLCISQLRKHLPKISSSPLASVRLVTDGKTIFRILDEDRLESMDEFGQFAFTFGIGDEILGLSKKVCERIRPIRYERQKKELSDQLSIKKLNSG